MEHNNYETEEIMTERLMLKKGNLNDFLKVYEYDFKMLKDVDGIFKFVKQDQQKIKDWFKGGIKKYYDTCKKAHMFDWIIYLDNEPIGNILSNEEIASVNGISLAYNLHPNYWGKGYMPEALEAVMNYLYKIGYDNIICGYSDGNKKSERVLKKLGYKPYNIKKDAWKSEKGNLIDDYDLIMTKDDWLSRTMKIKKIKGSM